MCCKLKLSPIPVKSCIVYTYQYNIELPSVSPWPGPTDSHCQCAGQHGYQAILPSSQGAARYTADILAPGCPTSTRDITRCSLLHSRHTGTGLSYKYNQTLQDDPFFTGISVLYSGHTTDQWWPNYNMWWLMVVNIIIPVRGLCTVTYSTASINIQLGNQASEI